MVGNAASVGIGPGMGRRRIGEIAHTCRLGCGNRRHLLFAAVMSDSADDEGAVDASKASGERPGIIEIEPPDLHALCRKIGKLGRVAGAGHDSRAPRASNSATASRPNCPAAPVTNSVLSLNSVMSRLLNGPLAAIAGGE
jgi:hypothetical protein